MNYYIEVIKYDNHEVVKTLGPYTERQANKADDCVNSNINDDEYYTLIKEEAK